MIKLIASDLDGTLLDEEKKLTKDNYEALQSAHTAGIEIVPATGRLYNKLPEAVNALDYITYVISVNGADVRNIRTGECIYSKELPLGTTLDLMHYYDTLSLPYYVYMKNAAYIAPDALRAACEIMADRSYLELLQKVCMPIDNIREYLVQRGDNVQKVIVMLRDQSLRRNLLDTLAGRFDGIAVSSSFRHNVEVNSAGADKGIALRKLAEHLGIRPEDTMAFGDGLNDREMLQAAGIGIAMANAEKEILRNADYVTDSNAESGVASAIRHFLPDLFSRKSNR